MRIEVGNMIKLTKHEDGGGNEERVGSGETEKQAGY